MGILLVLIFWVIIFAVVAVLTGLIALAIAALVAKGENRGRKLFLAFCSPGVAIFSYTADKARPRKQSRLLLADPQVCLYRSGNRMPPAYPRRTLRLLEDRALRACPHQLEKKKPTRKPVDRIG